MVTKRKNESNFLVQGSILAIASLLSRVIGLIYRIPLTNIIGDVGNDYYGAAMEVYSILLLISSYSLPLAVSKLVSTRLAKGETIDKLLYDNYSTISLGYAGLYEMCQYMTGKSHTDKEAKPFALAVMKKLNDKCAEWKAAENIGYSVYGTPLESTTYKFAKALQRRFGKIENVTDHNYITNSYHVNVREEIDAFTKLSFEAEFQELSPGGWD